MDKTITFRQLMARMRSVARKPLTSGTIRTWKRVIDLAHANEPQVLCNFLIDNGGVGHHLPDHCCRDLAKLIAAKIPRRARAKWSPETEAIVRAEQNKGAKIVVDHLRAIEETLRKRHRLKKKKHLRGERRDAVIAAKLKSLKPPLDRTTAADVRRYLKRAKSRRK
jgi:hypothetical protein